MILEFNICKVTRSLRKSCKHQGSPLSDLVNVNKFLIMFDPACEILKQIKTFLNRQDKNTHKEGVPSNVVSLAQCMLPFLQDKLRFAILLRLVGASDTRRAARLSSSCMAVRVRGKQHASNWYVRF